MSSVFSVAVSGMNAAAKRLLNSAINSVNASSTGKIPSEAAPQTTAYRPTDVVTVSNSTGDNRFGVTTQTIERTPAFSVARDEDSPSANADGLVAVPNVDLASEAVETIMAQMAYKANAKVIEVERRNQETLIDTLT